MKFYDLVTLKVASGKGGDGAATGRKEKYVPYGGPSGGDGGEGGSVYFVASHDEYTLMPYRGNKTYKAQHGEQGQGKDMYGKAGEDIILPVPVGTVIKDHDTGATLAELYQSGQRVLIAQGGRGGAGNKHFVSSKKQFSTIALLGEPGNERILDLELQLLGDIGLVGVPSVGKSSIINLVTNVKAKTAEYHFTTITPNLGVAEHKGIDFTIIDIPGLIDGAHQGKGLGNEFLRHIIKSRVLFFVLDVSLFDSGMSHFGLLFDEICQYMETQYSNLPSPIHHEIEKEEKSLIYRVTTISQETQEKEILMQKRWSIIINKTDIVNDEELIQEYIQQLTNTVITFCSERFKTTLSAKDILNQIVSMSAATGKGKDVFLDRCIYLFELTETVEGEIFSGTDINSTDHLENYVINTTDKEYDSLIEKGYLNPEVTFTGGIWEIYNSDVAFLVYSLPRGNDEAELWFWNTLQKEGHIHMLEKAGITKGDILHIKSPYHGVQDRRIMRE